MDNSYFGLTINWYKDLTAQRGLLKKGEHVQIATLTSVPPEETSKHIRTDHGRLKIDTWNLCRVHNNLPRGFCMKIHMCKNIGLQNVLDKLIQ